MAKQLVWGVRLNVDGFVTGNRQFNTEGGVLPAEYSTEITLASHQLMDVDPGLYHRHSDNVPRWKLDGSNLPVLQDDPRPAATFAVDSITAEVGDSPEPTLTVTYSVPATTRDLLLVWRDVPIVLSFVNSVAVMPISTVKPERYTIGTTRVMRFTNRCVITIKATSLQGSP